MPDPDESKGVTRSPLEAHSNYRGQDWSPQRLMFHQNLETFADRVGLIVALQSNGKMSQERAYTGWRPGAQHGQLEHQGGIACGSGTRDHRNALAGPKALVPRRRA